MTYNISLGVVIGVIVMLERRCPDQYDQRLLFMIKSIYSIKLCEYYNQITAEHQSKVSYTNNKASEIFKNDFMKDYTNYDKLIAGSFINLNMNDDLLPKTNSRKSRSNRKIQLIRVYIE